MVAEAKRKSGLLILDTARSPMSHAKFGLALLFFAAPILAQTFGEITGEIRDSSGGIVVSAHVSVTNQATGGTRTARTNQDGVYSFPSLPPGLYDLKVTAGFEVVTRKGIELQVQQTARIDFALPVSEVTQTIEISGGAPMLTTEDPTVGTLIGNRRLVDLPLNGRH